ncbi:MAG TPA: ABC transporter substrate-binding protein [Xanthobacteraceae bacterium]|jgi:putative tryptophan/tyrosine transport system substrate-binding protein
MRRREFVGLLGGTLAAWPLAAPAALASEASGQRGDSKVPRIGVLLPGTAASFALRTKAFLDGLRELGYIEGQTIAIEWRWGQDRVEGFAELAADLVGRNVDVLVTGGTPAAKALKSATGTIPIVMAIIGDPVAAGLVDSLARPGGNATGFSIVAPDLSGKRLELLKEIVPGISRVAVMLNAGNPQSQFELREMQAAAQAMGLHLHPVQISSQDALEEAFAAMSRASAHALICLTDPMFFSQRRQIVELAGRSRLPAMYFFQGFAEEGGLVSYGPSDTDLYRRSATYVDRILHGAKPSELPVEQPTKFDLVINLNAAKALGLDISPMLLARADKVIE